MKKLVILALLSIGQFAFAQKTQNLGDFTAVRAYDKINVTLMHSSENKIELRGNNSDNVEVVTKNGDLKIRMKASKMFGGEDVEATLYYKGTIDNVEASEGATVTSPDTFKAIAFEVNAKEGAKIVLKVDTDRLKVIGNSGGKLELKGNAKNNDITMSSGATLQATDLSTQQTIISLKAGGSADVKASDFVEAKTFAGGTINIYGNPKQVNQKTVAGGNIVVKD